MWCGLSWSSPFTLQRRRIVRGCLEPLAETEHFLNTETGGCVLHIVEVVLVQLELSCVHKVQKQFQTIFRTLLEAELCARCRGSCSSLLEQVAETGQDVPVGQEDHSTSYIQRGVAKRPYCPLLVQAGQDAPCVAALCSGHRCCAAAGHTDTETDLSASVDASVIIIQ